MDSSTWSRPDLDSVAGVLSQSTAVPVNTLGWPSGKDGCMFAIVEDGLLTSYLNVVVTQLPDAVWLPALSLPRTVSWYCLLSIHVGAAYVHGFVDVAAWKLALTPPLTTQPGPTPAHCRFGLSEMSVICTWMFEVPAGVSLLVPERVASARAVP